MLQRGASTPKPTAPPVHKQLLWPEKSVMIASFPYFIVNNNRTCYVLIINGWRFMLGEKIRVGGLRLLLVTISIVVGCARGRKEGEGAMQPTSVEGENRDETTSSSSGLFGEYEGGTTGRKLSIKDRIRSLFKSLLGEPAVDDKTVQTLKKLVYSLPLNKDSEEKLPPELRDLLEKKIEQLTQKEFLALLAQVGTQLEQEKATHTLLEVEYEKIKDELASVKKRVQKSTYFHVGFISLHMALVIVLVVLGAA